ncbi:mechanosensitive ion channel domain-containing protein [Roseivivax sp. CAU 1761]
MTSPAALAPRALIHVLTLVCALLLSGLLPAAAQPAPEAAGGAADTASETGAALEGLALQSFLEVLKNEGARQKLVEQLEKVTSEEAGADAAGAAEDGSGEGPALLEGEEAPAALAAPSLGGRIAEFTQRIGESAVEQIDAFLDSFRGSGSLWGGLSGDALPVIIDAFGKLLLVIAITVAVFLGLRFAAIPLFRRMGERAVHASAVRSLLIFVGGALLDALIVFAAWALGYAITLLAVGDYGAIGFRQALYLNAFLLVEMTKVVIRIILAPAAGRLRLINVSDSGARSLYRVCNVVVSVLGYGQLLVVPIVNRSVSTAAGLGVSALLAVLVLLFLVGAVLRFHKPVADWLARRIASGHFVDETEIATSGPVPDRMRVNGVMGSLIRLWHWFMLAFLAYMFVVVMTRPADVVFAYLTALGKVLLAALLGSLIVGAFGRAARRGIALPDELKKRLPLLERRLNKLVPKILIALRILVTVVVVLYALDVLGLADVSGWLSTDRGLNASGALVSVAFILLVAAAIWLAMNSWIDYRLNPDYGKAPTSREETLLSLLRNAATIALLLLTVMFALSEIGIDIGPLLASAGVLGLAIGFGAQKLVQDIITGVFIQLENAMNVGDVVTVGGTTGTVEKLTIRSVALRALDGTYHIIPFSSLDMVSNYMRDFAYFVCDMGIAYREDVNEAKQAMLDAFEELKSTESGAEIIGELEWFGLNSFGDSAVVLRARIKTKPGSQWGVGRAYNGIIKRIFDERGIEIPFPHQTLYFGEDKAGRTQALRLREVDRDTPEIEADSPDATRDRAAAPTEDAPPDVEPGVDR